MAGTLRALGKDLFAIDHPLRMPGGIELGTRTCVVRLSGGGVLVHAPGPLTDTLRAEIAALGPVRALVAPNLLHHLFVAENMRAFPEARVFVAPGLREKLPELRADAVLAERADPLFAADLEPIVIGGAPSLNEVVFVHRASRTLLALDLCFNVCPPVNLQTRVMMTVNGVYKHFAPSRIFRYAILKDAAALRASLDRILAHDFDRITIAHGAILESGGRAHLERVFAWAR